MLVESYLEMACEGERTFVGAAKLNQISLMVSFMLLESGGGGMRGRSFFKSSDSTPSSYGAQENRVSGGLERLVGMSSRIAAQEPTTHHFQPNYSLDLM